MRYFNTSGPNIIEQHYTIIRTNLIKEGMLKVHRDRYFTIWAPRQTGKSTFFSQLATELTKDGYKVAHVNFENFEQVALDLFVHKFATILENDWQFEISKQSLQLVFQDISRIQNSKLVLMVDMIEGMNPTYLGQFLHSIRQIFHTRQSHRLKSVIIGGFSNIVGDIANNDFFFNITDDFTLPYFTNEETKDLLGQYESETGHHFTQAVQKQISEITANHPQLVNYFALKLIDYQMNKSIESHGCFLLKTEDLNQNTNKNIENIINISKKYRNFVERLLFTEEKVPFQIYKEHIKDLFVNGIIIADTEGFVAFRVPLYKKCLHDAFYPYLNGEQNRIQKNIDIDEYFTETGLLNMPKVIEKYKEYAKMRGFRFFLDRDDKGKVVSIREAALMYSFETYISAFLGVVGGSSYIEPHINLGIADITIDINGQKAVVEAKVYHNITQFKNGKNQTAYYASRMGLTEGTYLVFVDSEVTHRLVLEKVDLIYGVTVTTYIIPYDLKTDFKKKKGQ
jgi:AAA-like domain